MLPLSPGSHGTCRISTHRTHRDPCDRSQADDQDGRAARRPDRRGIVRARTQMDERRQLEMQLPDDRRKEFVVSIDTAHVRSADANSARNFEIVVARCGRGGRGDAVGRYFVTSNTDQAAIRDRALHALRREGYCGFGDVTVISDGAEILKRLPRAMPRPTTHIIDWFHVAMKIQPCSRSRITWLNSALTSPARSRPSTETSER